MVQALFITFSILLTTGGVFWGNKLKIDLKKYEINTIKASIAAEYFQDSTAPNRTLDKSIAFNNKFSPNPDATLKYPISIIYDLTFSYKLNRFSIYNDGPINSIKNFRLLHSIDGVTYSLFYTSPNLLDKDYLFTDSFPQIRAKYIKLEILESYGELPEFREIQFYSATPVMSEIKGTTFDPQKISFYDSILQREISPRYFKTIAEKGILISDGESPYLYNENKMEFLITNKNVNLIEFLFYENAKIDRELQITIPETGFTTNLVLLSGMPRYFYFSKEALKIGNHPIFTIQFDKISGPNAFISSIGIYGKEKKQYTLSEKRYVHAFKIPSTVFNSNRFRTLRTNHTEDLFEIIKHPLLPQGILTSAKTKGTSLLIHPHGVLVTLQLKEAKLDLSGKYGVHLYFSFDKTQNNTYNNNVYHYYISLLDRGDKKPKVDLIKHIGQTIDFGEDILSNPLFKKHQANIDHSNHLIQFFAPWPETSDKNLYGFNFIYSEKVFDDDTSLTIDYLASDSDEPINFGTVLAHEFKPLRVEIPNSIYNNANFPIQIFDQNGNKNFEQIDSVELTFNGQKMSLWETDKNSSTFYTNLAIKTNFPNDQIKIGYQKTNYLIKIIRGKKGTLKIENEARKPFENLKEKETIYISLKDSDLNVSKSILDKTTIKIIYQFKADGVTLSELESILELIETKPDSGDFEASLVLPRVFKINPNINGYNLKLEYTDFVTEEGITKEVVSTNFQVVRNIPIFKLGQQMVKFSLANSESEFIEVGFDKNMIINISGKFPDSQEESDFNQLESWLFYLSPLEAKSKNKKMSLENVTFLFSPNFIPSTVTNIITKTNFLISEKHITNYLPKTINIEQQYIKITTNISLVTVADSNTISITNVLINTFSSNISFQTITPQNQKVFVTNTSILTEKKVNKKLLPFIRFRSQGNPDITTWPETDSLLCKKNGDGYQIFFDLQKYYLPDSKQTEKGFFLNAIRYYSNGNYDILIKSEELDIHRSALFLY